MIFTDGACPLCDNEPLKLNNDDLMECSACHLQLALFDPLIATVIPLRGEGKFREDQSAVPELVGIAIAKSIDGSVLPDPDTMFLRQEDLVSYVEAILGWE